VTRRDAFRGILLKTKFVFFGTAGRFPARPGGWENKAESCDLKAGWGQQQSGGKHGGGRSPRVRKGTFAVYRR